MSRRILALAGAVAVFALAPCAHGTVQPALATEIAGKPFEEVEAWLKVEAPKMDRDEAIDLIRRTVSARVETINGAWGLSIQTFPIDYWNTYKGGRLKDRAIALNKKEVYGRELAKLAWELSAGACEEHASVVRELLAAAGITDVTVLRSTSPHAFPVIGLQPGYDPDNPWTWGPDVIIPDSWNAETVRGIPAIWEHKLLFAKGACFVASGKEKLTAREQMGEFVKRGRTFITGHCSDYRRLLGVHLRFPPEIRKGFPYDPPLDACINPATTLFLAAVEYETYDPDLDEFVPGWKGGGPNSSWELKGRDFVQVHRKLNFTMRASWADPPTFLEAGAVQPLSVSATLEGTEKVQVAVYPVMDVGTWEITAKEAPGVDRPKANAYRLTLGTVPDKPFLASGTLQLDLGVKGGAKTIQFATGDQTGGTASLGSVQDLFLQMEIMHRIVVRWTYSRVK